MSKIINNKSTLLYRKALLPVLSLFITLLISSCATHQAVPSQNELQLIEQNKSLSIELKQLQQKLIEKQEEIKKLVLSKQHSTREIVRTQTKLRSHNNKADTVANLAEVKTVLKAVADKQDEQILQIIQETEQVITMSVEALKRGNIDKAFQLSNKAQQLIQPIRAKQVKDAAFIDPLTMKVLITCNVRTDPGMGGNVLFTLNGGTQIEALAYVKNWIQIRDEKMGKGWVYSRLLEIAE